MKIILPDAKYLESYALAGEEYRAANETRFHFANPKECDVVKMYADFRKGVNLPTGYVKQTTYWLIDNNVFVGQVNIRHELVESLIRRGGHIGYGVRIPFWRQGYATKLLNFALDKCREMKIDKVLITCDDDNIGSYKTVEKCGGVLQDKIENIVDGKNILTRRYWITL